MGEEAPGLGHVYTRRKAARLRRERNRLQRELVSRDPEAHFRDRKGRPINLFRWARLFERWSYKVVAHTVVGQDAVSTLWLGHDSFPGPMFESALILGPKRRVGPVQLYPDEAAALHGHARLVTLLQRADTGFDMSGLLHHIRTTVEA